MPQICLYLHLHQPYRLQPFSVFDVGRAQPYFSAKDQDENKIVFEKVARKSYIPMLRLLQQLIAEYPHTFVFSLSITGIFLEQAQAYQPDLIKLLQELVATGNVEILAETYYHSLASLYSEQEFRAQVELHVQTIQQLFHYTPRSFRNTELIYADWIGQHVAEMGFVGLLTEAVDRYLEGRPKTQVFVSDTKKKIPLLLKHAQLSDDIAFRFSANHHAGTPLTADTFVHWVNQYGEQEFVNLFMDFETFGEHQWEDTGIFEFFRHFVKKFLAYEWNHFTTPTTVFEQVNTIEHLPIYHVPDPISWADIDRDITAWRGNSLQWDTLRLMYELESSVLATKDTHLIHDWRLLQTSDHFYYMCIKWSADGDVHAYFSPYASPLDAYNRYTTVLADFRGRLNGILDT